MKRNVKIILSFFILFVFFSGCGSSGITAPSKETPPTGLINAAVTRVVDGDTIHVTVGGQKGKVRLIGVDTPEIAGPATGAQPFGREAYEYTKTQLYGKRVYLETDLGLHDRHGRLLAYVWLEKPTAPNDQEIRAKMFNARLLYEGYAQLMTVPPNVKYAYFFKQYQAEARLHNRGLWKLSNTESVYADKILPGGGDPANPKNGCVSCKGCRR